MCILVALLFPHRPQLNMGGGNMLQLSTLTTTCFHGFMVISSMANDWMHHLT